MTSLRSGDGLAQTGTTLARAEVLTANDGLGLLDNLLALGEDKLDVARVGHVRVDLIELSVCNAPFCFWHIRRKCRLSGFTYTTVGTVCPSPLLGGLVDLDVLDNQVAGVEALGVGVGLSVLEKTEEELGGLGGPAGLGDTELLAC